MSDQDSKEIIPFPNRISILAPKIGSKEINPSQGVLDLEIERDVGGIGMGVLSDGTPYLNQRGLATLCGVQNAHIGTISSQWSEPDQKPRIVAIKSILAKVSAPAASAHVEISHRGKVHYCYPADVCLAVLEYYAFDAGTNCQPEARDNFRVLAGSKLRELIYSQVGYDPTGKHVDRFKDWHDRIALNHQAAPRGFFDVFNEAHTIIYELILAGANVGAKTVVDISIGLHWSKHWVEGELELRHGERCRYPHNYPDSHAQAKSNPQWPWAYPLAVLGEYRQWVQDVYIEGGKFTGYLNSKVAKGELAPSVAQLAISAIVPAMIEGPGA
jgi:hypothetical protein